MVNLEVFSAVNNAKMAVEDSSKTAGDGASPKHADPADDWGIALYANKANAFHATPPASANDAEVAGAGSRQHASADIVAKHAGAAAAGAKHAGAAAAVAIHAAAALATATHA